MATSSWHKTGPFKKKMAELDGGDSGFRELTAADIAEAVGGFG